MFPCMRAQHITQQTSIQLYALTKFAVGRRLKSVELVHGFNVA
jgi:hypothetical protein